MAEDRRTVLKLISGALGGGCAVAVGAPIVGALVAPATKRTVQGLGDFVAVLDEDALPEDGSPLAVAVIIDAPTDAWSKLPPTRVGAVLVRRDPAQKTIVAFSTVCPHLGCRVDYQAERSEFICPCHDSAFELDGSVRSGPSPRGLDALETRVVEGKIEVRFEKFKTGTSEKVEV